MDDSLREAVLAAVAAVAAACMSLRKYFFYTFIEKIELKISYFYLYHTLMLTLCLQPSSVIFSFFEKRILVFQFFLLS